MAAVGYFFKAFAVDAPDNTPIPVTGSSGNPITYPYGYGADYALNLLTNPAALPIGRTTMNQLFLDITSQLQQYSQFGTPLFITSSQNQGTDFPYAQYARVRYIDGNTYESQVGSNTSLPGTDANWLRISGDSTGVLPGCIIAYGGITVPSGYLACDDSAVLRTTYATLFAAVTQVQTVTTTVSSATVTVASTNNLYVGMQIECANFAPGTTILTITPSTTITVSSAATAGSSVPMTFFQWGNGDGSTTFNTPNLPRKTLIGAGGTPYAGTTAGQVNSNAIGFTTTEEAHTPTLAETFAHTHAPSSGGFVQTAAGGSTLATGGVAVNVFGATASAGSSTPFNIMQPSAIVNYIIKT